MAKPRGVSPSSIDATQLERIARIARSLPGRVVSVQQRAGRPVTPPAGASGGPSLPAASRSMAPPPMLRIDGVAAAEILARYEHAGLA